MSGVVITTQAQLDAFAELIAAHMTPSGVLKVRVGDLVQQPVSVTDAIQGEIDAQRGFFFSRTFKDGRKYVASDAYWRDANYLAGLKTMLKAARTHDA